MRLVPPVSVWLSASLLAGCSTDPPCGPTRAVVSRVIDGDTVELTNGTRVRYLMVDAPETTGGQAECHGAEALAFNRRLVEGREVTLTYDAECTDRYGRLLAYVSVDGRELSSALVELGHACVLRIPPNGAERAAEFEGLEGRAAAEARGLWGRCNPRPCR